MGRINPLPLIVTGMGRRNKPPQTGEQQMPESIMLLVMSMLHRRPITLTAINGTLATGIVNTIQAEDGSGSSFNVILDNGTRSYLKRPTGLGTAASPIKSNRNAETHELVRS